MKAREVGSLFISVYKKICRGTSKHRRAKNMYKRERRKKGKGTKKREPYEYYKG